MSANLPRPISHLKKEPCRRHKAFGGASNDSAAAKGLFAWSKGSWLITDFRLTSLRATPVHEARNRVSLAFFRDAPWLTQHRIRDYASILILVSVAIIAWLLMGQGIVDPQGRPIGTNFISFWTVSWALLHDRVQVIYAPEILAALEHSIEGGVNAFYAWLYPPIALLIVYPLALLPYLWSLLIWLAAGAALYLTALWRILPRPLTL